MALESRKRNVYRTCPHTNWELKRLISHRYNGREEVGRVPLAMTIHVYDGPVDRLLVPVSPTRIVQSQPRDTTFLTGKRLSSLFIRRAERTEQQKENERTVTRCVHKGEE